MIMNQLQLDVLSRSKPLIDTLLDAGSFSYIKNEGNWGDALIDQGNKNLFDHLSLDYEQVPYHKNEGLMDTVVMGGGGSFCRFWHFMADRAFELSKRVKNVIVLPSTFDYQIDMPSNVKMFSRDSVYKFYSLSGVNDYITPDLALLSNPEKIESNLGKLTAWRHNVDTSHKRPKPPMDNMDVSNLGSHNSDPRLFLRIIGSHREVESDRLHIVIAAVVQNVPKIVMRPNGYNKNRSVFRNHRALFRNVEFREW